MSNIGPLCKLRRKLSVVTTVLSQNLKSKDRIVRKDLLKQIRSSFTNGFCTTHWSKWEFAKCI
jgi:hypothetical protein